MSAIVFARCLQRAKFIQRGHLKYWRPGPPPKTKEEHEAAARKYNMIPEDYKPHPEDENWGDYPDLPWASVESRDPYEPWDYYYSRRSYGEPS
ncbi:NADH dehydrogenase [ubiquinone] 1 beta subcomplex subunit 8-like protein [Leptotrombidium deliense]|uniref:NADH dehydrogenase [ubiquinone] 1 beta subcomplex subunit 8-like protein n=1 Tax=Leptotrombidium deliense TaxID=299467 RepID=A0A443SEZ8_9ACAR|nr:NADH dehydrogenase [ubiquinone] 1 beta subcomplex subunit 8-like protein [Leptotrombidium deliense]